VSRALIALVALMVPLVVLSLLDQEKYFLNAAFGVLFVGLSDPGGQYRDRFVDMAGVGIAGALVTALGFALGGTAWGWAVLGTFLVTVLCGLALKFGAHRFASGILLNAWFLVELAVPAGSRRTASRPGHGSRPSPGSSGPLSGSRSAGSGGWHAGGRHSPPICRSSPRTRTGPP